VTYFDQELPTYTKRESDRQVKRVNKHDIKSPIIGWQLGK